MSPTRFICIVRKRLSVNSHNQSCRSFRLNDPFICFFIFHSSSSAFQAIRLKVFPVRQIRRTKQLFPYNLDNLDRMISTGLPGPVIDELKRSLSFKKRNIRLLFLTKPNRLGQIFLLGIHQRIHTPNQYFGSIKKMT